MNHRPLSITIIGGFFIGLGTFVILANVFWLTHGQGLVHGMHEGVGGQGSGVGDGTGTSEHSDLLWVFGTQLAAIVAGVFLLRGRNWARWLLVVWLVFHIGLGALHPGHALLVHGVLTVVLVWFLFRPAANEFFRGGAGTAEG